MTRRILGLLITLALFGLLVSRELLAGSTGGRPRGDPILIGATWTLADGRVWMRERRPEGA